MIRYKNASERKMVDRFLNENSPQETHIMVKDGYAYLYSLSEKRATRVNLMDIKEDIVV